MKQEKVSLRELLGSLKVGQLWGIGVAIVGIISATYGLGYKTATIVHSERINRLSLQRDQFEAQLSVQEAGLKDLSTKDLFLSLYLRYQLAKESTIASDATDNEFQAYDLARKAFDTYLQENVGRERMTLRKGEGRQATMVFADGTFWRIPKELHMTLAD